MSSQHKGKSSYQRESNEDEVFAEQIYKRLFDHNGGMQEKIVKVCEMLDISPKDLQVRINTLMQLHSFIFQNRKLDDFSDGGKVSADIAKVRFEYHKNKRKAKLIAINSALTRLSSQGAKSNNTYTYCSLSGNVGNAAAITQSPIKNGTFLTSFEPVSMRHSTGDIQA